MGSAATELAGLCVKFLKNMTAYDDAKHVVAMPSSQPGKPFDLPSALAAAIAAATRRTDLSSAVKTTVARRPLKDVSLAAKLDALVGTIDVDRAAVRGKTVLLIDDLYQSGITMNYVGMLLLDAGASAVYGLACEKTCRNDDNVRGK